MRNTIDIKKHNKKSAAGFTLIEIAISLILLGLIIIPALSIYQNFVEESDFEETQQSASVIINELSSFNATYGRLPCPASITDVRGDATYGFELANCQAAAPALNTCSNGICAYASLNPGRIVLVGAVPFKDLNIFEEQTYDHYGSKLTYAVTLNQTDTATYATNGGGISIVSSSNMAQSQITPPNSAHYIIISHGENKAGAYSPSAAQVSCMNGSLTEQENCDADAVFAAGEIATGFDDTAYYFDGVIPTEWKKQASDVNNIFLKDSNSIGVGVMNSTDVSNADHLVVRNIGADADGTPTGIIKADNSFLVDNLCEAGAVNDSDCFQPRLIAGTLEDDGTRLREGPGGNGMSCYDGTNDQYMTGISQSGPICSDEVFLTCPDGELVQEIQADGTLVCDFTPQRCAQETVTNFCGETVTLGSASTASDGTTASGVNHFEYSGECRMFPPSINNNTVRTRFRNAVRAVELANPSGGQAAIDQLILVMNNEITSINATPRVSQQCSSITSTPPGLVRDSYTCDSGSWQHLSSHELGRWPRTTFSNDLTAGGWREAENFYTGTEPDPYNTNGNHDCWCKENYRMYYGPNQCPNSDQTGLVYRLVHQPCPQTSDGFNVIDYNARILCGACTDGTEPETRTCNEHYDIVNGTSGTTGLSGTVTLTYNTTCSGSGERIRDTSVPPTITGEASCACSSNGPNFQRDQCPANFTNGPWSSGGFINEVNVTEIRRQDWVCPSTSTGGIQDPGYYGPFTTVPGLSIPSCTCDTTPIRETRSCPPGEAGLGIFYDAPRDCTTGGAVTDESLWVEVSRDCDSCEWTVTGAPAKTSTVQGPPPGSDCACGTPNELYCSEFDSLGQYNSWSPCECNPK